MKKNFKIPEIYYGIKAFLEKDLLENVVVNEEIVRIFIFYIDQSNRKNDFIPNLEIFSK